RQAQNQLNRLDHARLASAGCHAFAAPEGRGLSSKARWPRKHLSPAKLPLSSRSRSFRLTTTWRSLRVSQRARPEPFDRLPRLGGARAKTRGRAYRLRGQGRVGSTPPRG